MMEDEKYLTEVESMQLITSMINKAKNRFRENGFLYLLWGWVVLFCCIIQFISQAVFHYSHGYFVWLLTWVVLIYQIFYLRKNKKTMEVRTYADEITGSIWITFVVVLFIGIFICMQYGHPYMSNSFILLFYGIPVFLSGAILKFWPLIFGGIFCWMPAIISPFVPFQYGTLLIAAAVSGAWIVPGYFLRIKYKKEN